MSGYSADHIDAIFEDTAVMDEAALQEQLERFSEQQPALLSYLMTTGETVLDENERELLLFLGMVVWRCFEKDVEGELSGEAIADAEAGNDRLLEALVSASIDHQGDEIEAFLDDYPQDHLLALIEDLVLFAESDKDGDGSEDGNEEDDPAEDPIRDENRPWLFVFLKTVIDALNHARSSDTD